MSHSVTFVCEDGDYFPSLEFTCTFTAAAPCRQECVHEACQEYGCSNPDEHEQRTLDTCNFVDWMENGDDTAGWVDKTVRLTAPVDVTWHGDEGPRWSLAPESRDEPLDFGAQP